MHKCLHDQHKSAVCNTHKKRQKTQSQYKNMSSKPNNKNIMVEVFKTKIKANNTSAYSVELRLQADLKKVL